MTLIRRLPNAVISSVNQGAQPENSVESQPELNPNFGVANSSDQFETAPENSYFLDPQAQSATLIEPSTTQDIIVESSSLFSDFEPNVGILDNRLSQLMDRLNSLTQRRDEIQSQIDNTQTELSKAKQALQSVTETMNSNLPITDELRDLLDPIGLVTRIADRPITLPEFGLRIFAKQRMQEVKNELERKIGELESNLESLKSQLAEVEGEMNSVSEEIAKEKERQAKEFQPFQTRDPITETKTIVAQEEVWQEALSDQNVIQNGTTPAAVLFNPIAQADIDD